MVAAVAVVVDSGMTMEVVGAAIRVAAAVVEGIKGGMAVVVAVVAMKGDTADMVVEEEGAAMALAAMLALMQMSTQ